MTKLKKVLVCTIPTNSSFSRLGRCGRESKGGEKWPPIRLMYIAGNLRKVADLSFIDGDADSESLKDFKSKVLSIKPEFIVVEPVQNSFKEEMDVIAFLRRHINFKLIVTGNFVSTFKDKISNKLIDVIAIGEAELNIKNYILHGKKQGLIIKEGKSFKKYEGKTFIENLDALEFPVHDLLNKSSYDSPFIKSHPFTIVETSRGCPFRCTYCSAQTMGGKRTRFRSAESVVKEIKQILELGFTEIKFNDETFTLDKQRLIEILIMLKKENLKFNWKCNSRADLFDKPMLKLMKETGCHLIFIGVESGNQRILDYYRKAIKIDKIKEGFALCRAAGIDTVAHFIIGAPEDNKKTISESINLAKSINATFTSFNLLVPYPGTEVYADLERKHLFVSEDIDNADPIKNSVIKTNYLSALELEHELKRAYRRFYFSPRYIFNKIISMKSLREFKNNLNGLRGIIKLLR